MSRKLFALGIVALLLLGLTSVVGLAQDTVTVSYYTFSAAPDHLEDLDVIIEAFEAENPGIQVEVTTAAWDDYFTLLAADFAAGEPPDTFELNYENFVSYAADDLLLDISEHIAEEAPYYPRALEAFQYDGVQLALPETFSTVLLFYNADLFDQAEQDYPAADWTWDDALEAGAAITALGDDIWGLWTGIQFWEFYKKAGQAGCEIFNTDMTESTINSEVCVETVEMMVGFMDDDIMPDDAEMAGLSDGDLFLNGELGMLTTGIWMFSAFEEADFNWDIQLEPGLANKGHHFFANGVAVAASTDNAEAAAAWAQFLTASETAATVRVETGWELPALDEPGYFEAYLELSPPENREAVFAALESPITPPVIERQVEMQDIIGAHLNAVVLGELTAQEALDEAKAQLDDLLE